MDHKKFQRVSIVLANYNDGKKVIRCLNSIFKLDYPSFEVIVIDNNSTDGSLEEIKKRFKKCRILKNNE